MLFRDIACDDRNAPPHLFHTLTSTTSTRDCRLGQLLRWEQPAEQFRPPHRLFEISDIERLGKRRNGEAFKDAALSSAEMYWGSRETHIGVARREQSVAGNRRDECRIATARHALI